MRTIIIFINNHQTIINNDTQESKEFRGHASESASLQTPVKGAANVLKIPGATQAIQ